MSAALSAVMGVVACVLLGIGIFAWTMPQLAPVKVVAGESASLGRTPWFDSGSTLFADVDATDTTRPAEWGCTLDDGGGGHVVLGTAPNPDLVGTRVVDDRSLLPVVTIGPTGDGSSITCSGPRARSGVAMWALPTDAGLPRVALSLVIAGIALLGAAAAVHPFTRGLVRFGG
ncbi:hypothetical protein [Branchiibius cervicis]|uniref:Uncharacterized protein n=1 Tax=Branchiibius cervicis TaxID=908252 RepID=A0ABW2AVF2_9MICO